MKVTKTADRSHLKRGNYLLGNEYTLLVSAGLDKGLSHTTSKERMVIGTHPSVDFELHDPTLSRFHCEISIVDGKAHVRDLGSRNGTLVGGVSVLHALLQDGAKLNLGDTDITFDAKGREVRTPLSERSGFGLLVGTSAPMRLCFAALEKAASSDATVLLEGETGTGKDVAAQSIHMESARKEGPFIVVDCGAIPENLLESELFGHERGAFTGADRAREGAFEAAHQGTLFLDEVGELGPALQPKFLRVLESGEIQRMGSTERKAANVRVIAATNRNLRAEVNAKRFRADLYYRLAVLTIRLPPLRDRLEDLPLLVPALIETLGSPASPDLTSEAFYRDLERHGWPGNVRELKNYLERSLAFEKPGPIDQAVETDTEARVDVREPIRQARQKWMMAFEKRYLEALLREHGGNVSQAARAAGVNRTHLHYLVSRCGLR